MCLVSVAFEWLTDGSWHWQNYNVALVFKLKHLSVSNIPGRAKWVLSLACMMYGMYCSMRLV